MKLRKRIQLALPVTLVLALIIAGIGTAAPQTIDAFTDEEVNISASAGTPSVLDDSATNTEILGDERDALVEWQSGLSNITLRIDVDDSNFLELQVGSGVHGRTLITWDGDDADGGATLDPTGLGGVDLVDTTNDGIVVNIASWDGNDLDITFTIYSNATDYSEAVLQLRGLAVSTATPFTLSFDDDFTTAGGSGATFTNVGAIQMEIQTIAPGADIALNVTLADPTRDFGDAPEAYGLTLEADDGARHTLGDIYLGATIDSELDGQESGDATGDGTDEDGVTVVGPWSDGPDGGTVAITYNAPGAFALACVNGWIDWNRDAVHDPGEDVVNQTLLSALGGPNYSFDVPAGTFEGQTGPVTFNSRWRIYPNTDQDLDCTDEDVVLVTGYVTNGEVEDYQWDFDRPTAITITSLTTESQGPTIWAAILGISTLLIIGGAALVYKHRRV